MFELQTGIPIDLGIIKFEVTSLLMYFDNGIGITSNDFHLEEAEATVNSTNLVDDGANLSILVQDNLSDGMSKWMVFIAQVHVRNMTNGLKCRRYFHVFGQYLLEDFRGGEMVIREVDRVIHQLGTKLFQYILRSLRKQLFL